MFDHINHWLRTLPEKLRQLPPLQRFAVLGIPAAVLAVLVVLVTLWGTGDKEQQQVLYSQLNMQDAGAIAANKPPRASAHFSPAMPNPAGALGARPNTS